MKNQFPLYTYTSNLHLTLKAWPVIAIATIGLSFLTQQGAKLLGIDLPEQTNIEIVKRCFSQAFVSAKHFGVAAFLAAQVVVLLPAIEEIVFRWGLFKLPISFARRARWSRPATVGADDPGGPQVVRRGTGDASGDRKALDARLWLVALVSSILFSAAHYIAQPWPDNAFLALFFFGFAQCWLYRRTRRLWCAMLNHALFNLTNLLLLCVV